MIDYLLDAACSDRDIVPRLLLPRLPESGITLVRWQSTKARVIRRCSLDVFTISWILRPLRADTWLDDKQVLSGNIGAQTFRITPPGINVKCQSDDDFDFLTIFIPVSTVERFGKIRQEDIHSMLSGSPASYMRDDLTQHLVLGMIEASVRATSSAYQLADALGDALVARLIELCLEPVVRPARERLSLARLIRVKEFVEAHLDENLSVGRLASIAALSEAHFARAFRQETGLSPHQYVLTQRIVRAQELLRSDQKSIFGIALQCGFSDASHFSRVFRRVAGTSPMTYRNDH